MFNPFAQIQMIKAEVFTRMPDKFRKRGRTKWSDPNRQLAEVDNFLEGPSFDRQGNLYVTDIPFGRIFKITPDGEWEIAAEYDGWPNGLKFHKDGRAFVACYKQGLMLFDKDKGTVEPYIETMYSERFKGLNDLHFTSNGDLYFTDQGQTGVADPTGRVFKLSAEGNLTRILTNVPSPNGITLNTRETQIYVAVTRQQQIWRLPIMHDGSVSKTGVAIQLSGGHAGPDGIEQDAQDGIYVCHLGLGIWRFDNNSLPTHLIYVDPSEHALMTNIAFGGPDRKTMYITDSQNGRIMRAEAPVPGKLLYGLS
jgi:gluconolactonase